MKCPFCGNIDSKVIDSRPTEDNQRIRRRRECMACQKRFTTFEIVEITPIMVVKKDGSIQAFNRDKVLSGMIKSCEKRQVSIQDLEKAADSIEYKLVKGPKGTFLCENIIKKFFNNFLFFIYNKYCNFCLIVIL